MTLNKESILRCLCPRSRPFGATDTTALDALASLAAIHGAETMYQVLVSPPVLASLGTDVYYDLHATGLLPFPMFLQAAPMEKVCTETCFNSFKSSSGCPRVGYSLSYL